MYDQKVISKMGNIQRKGLISLEKAREET
jgi:hypothetical protein